MAFTDGLLDLLSRHEYITYMTVFLTSFLEGALFLGFLIPGETIVVLSGFLAVQGHINLGDCIAIIAAGAILGDSVGYFIGKAVGKGYFERHRRLFFIQERHVRKTDGYFLRHGGKTVFIGRFVGFLRTMAPFAAGMSEMPYRRFLAYNVIGGIVWAATFTLLGYFFRESWHSIRNWLSKAGMFILFLVMLLASLRFLSAMIDRRKELVYTIFSAAFVSGVSGPGVTSFLGRHPAFFGLLREGFSPEGYVALQFKVEVALSSTLSALFS